MSIATLNRRQMLLALAGGVAPLLAGCQMPGKAAGTKRTGLGIVTYCFNISQKNRWAGRYPGMAPALAFLEECHRLGAAGIQFAFGPDDASSLQEIRRRAERYEMRVEAIVTLPASETELGAFEQKVSWGKSAGATLARTAVLPGRRYEEFKTLDDFHQAEGQARKNLQRVEPVLARHDFRLAIENHKDQLVPEKLQMLRQLGSEHLGLCLDVGNNIALAEEPLSVVRALAPYALTIHFKDHIAAPYPDGYLLWDAALGEGLLDLAAMVKMFRELCPRASINLEVITRDPLKIPINTDAYWATLPGQRDAALAWILPMVKNSPAPRQPPLAGLSPAQQMALELRHCETSLRYAREHLRV